MSIIGASLIAQLVKNPPATRETWVYLWVGKIPWTRAWQPTPVFLPGESPWIEEPGGLCGPQELDTAERQSIAAHRSVVTILMFRARKLRLNPYP